MATSHSNLKPYLQQLSRCPRFDVTEERELVRAAKGGCQASREQLVLSQLPWAMKIAMQFRGRGFDDDELVQIANMGLLKAVDKCDPRRGRLSTVSNVWIRQTLLYELQQRGRLVHVPGHALRAVAKPHERAAAERACRNTVSLDVETDHPNGGRRVTAGELIPDPRPGVDFDAMELRERSDQVEALMSRLSLREQLIVRDRIDGETLLAVAEQWGITKERVRQIEAAALDKLRKWAGTANEGQ